jgi:hypothetical protein
MTRPADAPAVAALAEPTEPVPARWIAAISLANLGLFTAWFGPIQVLLGRGTEARAPANKEAALGLEVGAGAAFAVIASPLFGALAGGRRAEPARRGLRAHHRGDDAGLVRGPAHAQRDVRRDRRRRARPGSAPPARPTPAPCC